MRPLAGALARLHSLERRCCLAMHEKQPDKQATKGLTNLGPHLGRVNGVV